MKFLLKGLTLKKILLRWGLLFLGLLILKAGWVAVFQVSGKSLIRNHERGDLLTRRAYLIHRINEMEKIEEMHGTLPPLFQGEWAVGTYSMLTAALANIAFLYPETQDESLRIIERLIDRMMTKEFRRFDTVKWKEDAFESLANENGHIGYLGHLNFMLATYRFLGGQQYTDLFHELNAQLVHKMSARPTLNAETYPQEVYIPDNVVVLASLSLYSRLYQQKYRDFINKWIQNAKQHQLDIKTGLLVHRSDLNGQPLEYTRGCSSGWNSFYLTFIDESFAKEQYQQIKKHLKKTTFVGLTGIREFPRDVNGKGDIDSGPVLLSLSTSGTGFVVAGAKFHRDTDFLDSLLLTAETIGSSVQWKGRRRYLLAPLVGDAIMLAMTSTTRWDKRFIEDTP